MEWYEAQYQGDPAADNVFGREALRPRRNVLLMAYLANGGSLSDLLILRRAQDEEKTKSSP
jgi:hypothetical protein